MAKTCFRGCTCLAAGPLRDPPVSTGHGGARWGIRCRICKKYSGNTHSWLEMFRKPCKGELPTGSWSREPHEYRIEGDGATCKMCGFQTSRDAAQDRAVAKCPLWKPQGWGDRQDRAAAWMREAQRLAQAWTEAGKRTEQLQGPNATAGAERDPEVRDETQSSAAAPPASEHGAAAAPGFLKGYRHHQLIGEGGFRICVGCGSFPPGGTAKRAKEWAADRCPGAPRVVSARVLAAATGPLAGLVGPGGPHADRGAWMFG